MMTSTAAGGSIISMGCIDWLSSLGGEQVWISE